MNVAPFSVLNDHLDTEGPIHNEIHFIGDHQLICSIEAGLPVLLGEVGLKPLEVVEGLAGTRIIQGSRIFRPPLGRTRTPRLRQGGLDSRESPPGPRPPFV